MNKELPFDTINSDLLEMLATVKNKPTVRRTPWFDHSLFYRVYDLQECIKEALALTDKLQNTPLELHMDESRFQYMAERLTMQYKALHLLMRRDGFHQELSIPSTLSKRDENRIKVENWKGRPISELYQLLNEYQQWRYQLEDNYALNPTDHNRDRLQRLLLAIEQLELFIEKRMNRQR